MGKVATRAHAYAFMWDFLARSIRTRSLMANCADRKLSSYADPIKHLQKPDIQANTASWNLQQPNKLGTDDRTRSYSIHVPQLPSSPKVHVAYMHARP
jgi:hypothetical protein